MLDVGKLVKELSFNLAEKHNFGTHRLTIEVESIERHVDFVLPLGILLIIVISNIMGRMKTKEKNVRISLRSLVNKDEVLIVVSKEKFFHDEYIVTEFGNEGEIAKSLIEQIGAECKTDDRLGNSLIINL
ncbi:MAG TPA: hypothetical protein ENN41_03400 [Sediminispirochaeta sp.]|nr:hypothetical protein [Sediminispirochaeta sp.]